MFKHVMMAAALTMLMAGPALAEPILKIYRPDGVPSAYDLGRRLYSGANRIILGEDGSVKVEPMDYIAAVPANFAVGDSDMPVEAKPFIDAIGKMMKLEGFDDKLLVIEGHTDATGPDALNMKLSKQRAEAIKTYLVKTYGIDQNRLETIGMGAHDLLDDKNPANAVNRRVQFHKPM